MANLTALNNITPLTINNSLINDSSTLIPNIIENTNNMTGGYFGLGVMLVLFIVFVIMTYREDAGIRMDITRSLMFSSGLVFILGLIAVTSPLGIFTSFVHVAWFGVIFVTTLLLSLIMKKKGY